MQNQLKNEFLTLRTEYIGKQFGNLNNMQREAVFTGKGPLLILAGAGSGKTTVLVNRIANLVRYGEALTSTEVYGTITDEDMAEIQTLIANSTKTPTERMKVLLRVNNIMPYNILAITFTNRAATELKTRIAKKLDDVEGNDINAATFHSSCVKILRREAERLGFPKAFTIYDTDDSSRAMKEIFKQEGIDDKFIPVKSALSSIGRLKDKMIDYKTALEQATDERAKLIAKVYAKYTKRLKKAGAMDFDDLIFNTVTLLENFTEVREYYQNRFKFILVDEYQDTSIAQFKLVDILSNAHKNICVVGDDDQSIYRFRGATIENILSFEENYEDAKVIKLEQNYRSTSNILNVANCVIFNNTTRKGKNLWTDNNEGNKICHFEAENEHEEASRIGGIISENLKNGGKLSDHAVLYRMNSQSNPIETYFARAGIPYKIFGGRKFFDRKEVKDILSYMSVVVNPQDDLRLKRIINEPSRKIGATTIDLISNIALEEEKSILDIVINSDVQPRLTKSSKALKSFTDIYHELVRTLPTMPLDEFTSNLVEVTGYKTMLAAQGEEGKTRMENIGQLVSSIKTYADQNGEEATLAGFLEDVALVTDMDNFDEHSDVVVMMTLHASKGLEFDNVFIVGLEEGVFPSELCRYNEEEVEEERRLCYVGMTRARKNLHLSSATNRMMFGQTKRNPKSRFLKEVDEEYIDYNQSAGAKYLAKRRQQHDEYMQKHTPTTRTNVSKSTITAGMYSTVGVQPNKSSKTYTTGNRVKHMSYGDGTIIKTTQMASDVLIEIKFDNMDANKKVMANYAKLTDL